MTFCPRCGHPLALGARSCGACGRRLGAAATEAASERGVTGGWLRFLLGLLVALLILVLLLRFL